MHDERLMAGAPDPAVRSALVDRLRAAGHDEVLLQQAAARGRLYALEGDQLVRPGAVTCTLEDVAARLGQEPAATVRLWRALGMEGADDAGPVATETEVDALAVWPVLAELVGEERMLVLARVHGAAAARTGEAVAATVVEAVPDVDLLHSPDELTTADAFAAAASLMPQMVRAVESLYRHHLLAATWHFEGAQAPEGFGGRGVPYCVAFADLCGFTAATERLEASDLHALLGVFEDVAHQEATAAGGRCVKLIGDAAMLVCASPDGAVRAAHRVVERMALVSDALPVRVGLAAGDVVVRAGDYFGPAVNLAARLLALAAPGEVVTEPVLAGRLGATWSVEAREAQPVKGVREPVAPHVVRRAPDGRD